MAVELIGPDTRERLRRGEAWEDDPERLLAVIERGEALLAEMEASLAALRGAAPGAPGEAGPWRVRVVRRHGEVAEATVRVDDVGSVFPGWWRATREGPGGREHSFALGETPREAALQVAWGLAYDRGTREAEIELTPPGELTRAEWRARALGRRGEDGRAASVEPGPLPGPREIEEHEASGGAWAVFGEGGTHGPRWCRFVHSTRLDDSAAVWPSAAWYLRGGVDNGGGRATGACRILLPPGVLPHPPLRDR